MRRNRCGRGRSERGSLPLALLASIIVAGLVVVLVARIVATQNQVRFDQGFHASLPVADAGVNLGKFWLNNDTELVCEDDGLTYQPSAFPVGCSTPAETRALDEGEYAFSLTRLGAGRWEISSVGEDARSGERRQVVATLSERPLVDVALFADTLIKFRGANSADSYTSDPEVDDEEAWCTGFGYVATNDVLDMHGTSGGSCHTHNRTIDRGMLHDWGENEGNVTDDDYPGGDRCIHAGGGGGANCRTVSEEDPEYLKPDIFEEELELSKAEKRVFIKDAIDACDTVEDDFATSDVDGVLVPGGEAYPGAELPGDLKGHPYRCVDALTFDVDTKIDTTSDEPVIFMVRSSVRIHGNGWPGGVAHVGCEDASGNPTACESGDPSGDGSRPAAGRLWIFVLDEGEITMGRHSTFAGIMWGPGATCDGQSGVRIFGSLLCELLPDNLGNWKFHYDEALRDVSSGEFYTSAWREEFISD